MSHVADDAAVLHAVEVLSHHNVLIAWWGERTQRTERNVEEAKNLQRKERGSAVREVLIKYDAVKGLNRFSEIYVLGGKEGGLPLSLMI